MVISALLTTVQTSLQDMPHICSVSVNDFLLYAPINHRGRGNSAGSEGVSMQPDASDQNVLGLYSRFVSGTLHCLGLELARMWQVLPGQSLPSSSHILETRTTTQQTGVSSLTVSQSTCDSGEFCPASELLFYLGLSFPPTFPLHQAPKCSPPSQPKSLVLNGME